jgi:hypothetical protein
MYTTHLYDSHDWKAKCHPPTCLSVLKALDAALLISGWPQRERDRERTMMLPPPTFKLTITLKGPANCEREEIQ